MGDASAAWVVGDSLKATGGNQTESPTLPDFTQASIPANPDGTNMEPEYEMGNVLSSVGNPSKSSTGREGSCERCTCQDTPL